MLFAVRYGNVTNAAGSRAPEPVDGQTTPAPIPAQQNAPQRRLTVVLLDQIGTTPVAVLSQRLRRQQAAMVADTTITSLSRADASWCCLLPAGPQRAWPPSRSDRPGETHPPGFDFVVRRRPGRQPAAGWKAATKHADPATNRGTDQSADPVPLMQALGESMDDVRELVATWRYIRNGQQLGAAIVRGRASAVWRGGFSAEDVKFPSIFTQVEQTADSAPTKGEVREPVVERIAITSISVMRQPRTATRCGFAGPALHYCPGIGVTSNRNGMQPPHWADYQAGENGRAFGEPAAQPRLVDRDLPVGQ